MQSVEEAAWICQAQTGDRDAFAELVKRYWSRIFRWLQGVSGCAHAAEDLTQETFIKAWQALPTYRNTHFRAWLFRIARNAWLDSRRREASRPTTALPENLPTPSAGPFEELLLAESLQTLEQAYLVLPEPVRSAFLLWIHEEMSHHEIALALDITEETARWRVFRARRLLLSRLSSQRGTKNG